MCDLQPARHQTGEEEIKTEKSATFHRIKQGRLNKRISSTRKEVVIRMYQYKAQSSLSLPLPPPHLNGWRL